jgi:hypothetical protein
MRVMERLNLTLDEGTSGALARCAMASRDALEHQRKLARDYAAGRDDAKEILEDMEAAQLELLGREDD